MTDPQILLDYEAHGLAIAERPGILDDLQEALDAHVTDDETGHRALGEVLWRLRAAYAAVVAELGRRAVAHHLAERDRLLEIATRPGNSQAVTDILRPLIATREDDAKWIAEDTAEELADIPQRRVLAIDRPSPTAPLQQPPQGPPPDTLRRPDAPISRPRARMGLGADRPTRTIAEETATASNSNFFRPELLPPLALRIGP